MLNYFLPFVSRMLVNINEPKKKRYMEYARKVLRDPRTRLNNVNGLKVEKKSAAAIQSVIGALSQDSTLEDVKFEDKQYQIPKSDILLSSHSLYYTVNQWALPASKGTARRKPLKSHLLTKLLGALNEKGVLCIIFAIQHKKWCSGKTGHVSNA